MNAAQRRKYRRKVARDFPLESIVVFRPTSSLHFFRWAGDNQFVVTGNTPGWATFNTCLSLISLSDKTVKVMVQPKDVRRIK